MSRLTLALALGILLVEAAVAAWILGFGESSDLRMNLSLALPAGLVFGIAGLLALARRPENRTGLYLAAVGYLWPLNVLADSGSEWIFAVGYTAGELAWVPFVALVLAYPTGRLETALERALPPATGVWLFGTALLVLLIDPTATRASCAECPESPIAVVDLPGFADAVRALNHVGVFVLLGLVVLRLVRRWRHATPTLKRLVWPVVGAAAVSLLAVALLVVAEEVAPGAADALRIVFFVAFATIPLAFLLGILQVRLARASVSEVAMALQRGVPLRDALARALRDPSLEIVYWLEAGRGRGAGGWVDPHGDAALDPTARDDRAVTIVEQEGKRIAALIHDPSFAQEPGLVDLVAATAGLALHNERLQAELRAEARLGGTLASTAPALLSNVDTDGRILTLNPAALRACGYADESEVVGKLFWDVFIDESEREDVKARFAAAAPHFPASEYENAFTNARGEQLVVYWHSAPVLDEGGRVVSIVAGGVDITERRLFAQEAERQRDFLRTVTETVPSFLVIVDGNALVVAGGVNRAFAEGFGWIEEEAVGRSFLSLIGLEGDDDLRQGIAAAAAGLAQAERETVWTSREGESRIVAWTARPVMDPEGRSLVLVSGSDVTIRRRQEEALRASRARILQAEDDARRKLERNLHDGAQQRLVALSISLRLAESSLEQDTAQTKDIIGSARTELALALEELRELARGIHPAVLTDRGLGRALEALIARSPVPVKLAISTNGLPTPVEVAAYYVVAESLTNIAKYAAASSASITVAQENGTVVVTVTDDGVGGADPATGSGLRGLADRLAALDGALSVESPPGGGTSIRAEIPLANVVEAEMG